MILRGYPESHGAVNANSSSGTRGIPANYGGFETFAEELATRLARRGYQVTVYCRERPSRRLIAVCACAICPPFAISTSTRWRTLRSTLHLLRNRVDVALYCNGANAIFTGRRLFGMPVR